MMFFLQVFISSTKELLKMLFLEFFILPQYFEVSHGKNLQKLNMQLQQYHDNDDGDEDDEV